MKKTIPITTNQHSQLLEITAEIQQEIDSDFSGILTIFVPHTTAGVTIQECYDPDVLRDIQHQLEQFVPWKNNYHYAEGNAAAHIKSSLIGSSVQIIVEKGTLQLGTWQGIVFCEFDGPRQRKVLIHLN